MIWNQIIKMYRFCYKKDEELKNLFTCLNLNAAPNDVKIDNIKEFFLTIPFKDALIIFRDILETDEFWPSEYDEAEIRNTNRKLSNYYQLSLSSAMFPQLEYVIPEHRLGGQELVHLLETKSGIVYDRKTNSFTFIGVSDIRVLPYSTRARTPLVGTKFNDYFYDTLVAEINSCYFSGLYTAAAILSRKLMETLIIDFLVARYPPSTDENLNLYYDKAHRRHRRFSELIDALESKKKEFECQEQTLSRFISRLHIFKTQANLDAHNLTIITDDNELSNYKVQEMIELLNALKRK